MLATLADVQAELRQLNAEPSAAEDAFILDRLGYVIRRVQSETDNRFAPRLETFGYNATRLDDGGAIYEESLYLGFPMLELHEIKFSGEAQDLSRFATRSALDRPIYKIDVIDGQGWLNQSSGAYPIQITGIWADRSPVSEAWVGSGDALGGDISGALTDNILQVTDVDAEDMHFNAPRFSPGALIRIDSEYMQVRKVNTSTNTLSVVRAVNGTEVAPHSTNAAIDLWRADEGIRTGVTRWTAMMYQRRAQFSRREIEGMNAKEFPTDMPGELKRILEQYRRVTDVRKI